jgi:hypothetical protein
LSRGAVLSGCAIRVKHSGDYQLNPVTCSASEVLAADTGFCCAKSQLLAALLRANGWWSGRVSDQIRRGV